MAIPSPTVTVPIDSHLVPGLPEDTAQTQQHITFAFVHLTPQCVLCGFHKNME